MDVARRLYVYLAAAVGLAFFAIGVARLLSLFLIEVVFGRGALLLGGADSRSDLSLAIALVVIGLPIWLVHWFVAQRGQGGEDEHSLSERRSTVRALYLGVVQLVAFVFTLVTAVSLVRGVLEMILGTPLPPPEARGTGVATLLVAGTIWLTHARVRALDLRRTQLHGAAARLPRLVRYTGAGLGLGVALTGMSLALVAVVDVAAMADQTISQPADWWLRSMIAPLASVMVGLAAWWLHWRDGESVIRDRDVVGEDERETKLRALYFGGILLAAAIAASVGLAVALYQLQELILGEAGLRMVAMPLVGAVPIMAAGLLHLRRQLAEADAMGAEADALGTEVGPLGAEATALGAEATAFGRGGRTGDRARTSDVERRAILLAAASSLAVMVLGVAALLSLTLDRLAGEATTLLSQGSPSSVWGDAAAPIGAAVAGAAVWLPSWIVVLRRRSRRPLIEARATASGVYLYAVLLAAGVVLVPASMLLLYRVVDAMLGQGFATGFLADQARTIAVLATACLVAAYHGWLLRADRRLMQAGQAQATTEAAEASRVATVEVPLMMSVPASADVAAVLASLQRVLPVGASIQPIARAGRETEDPTVPDRVQPHSAPQAS